MKIILLTNAEDFSHIKKKYEIYEPAFIKAHPDGDIEVMLDIKGDSFEYLINVVFLIGKSCAINQFLKYLKNAKIIDYDFSTEQAF
jgi:hypothetical protein